MQKSDKKKLFPIFSYLHNRCLSKSWPLVKFFVAEVKHSSGQNGLANAAMLRVADQLRRFEWAIFRPTFSYFMQITVILLSSLQTFFLHVKNIFITLFGHMTLFFKTLVFWWHHFWQVKILTEIFWVSLAIAFSGVTFSICPAIDWCLHSSWILDYSGYFVVLCKWCSEQRKTK